jgi:hypothetical protein
MTDARSAVKAEPDAASAGRRDSIALGPRVAAWALAGLMTLVPFEPTRPLLAGRAMSLTLLEAAAALAFLVLFWTGRRSLGRLLRAPPAPVVLLALYAVAHVVSAAEAGTWAGARFALRTCAAAAFAAAVAASDPDARRRGLRALGLAGVVAAGLAIGEGAGLLRLDPFLDLFRESAFVVGGTRRASAGSEYPNLGAFYLMLGLVAGAGVGPPLRRGPMATAIFAALVSFGLLATYSRGALISSVLALAVMALVQGRRAGIARTARTALVLLLGTTALFATAATFRLRLSGAPVEGWFRARYEPLEASAAMRAGETRTFSVRVVNTGGDVWHAGAVLLGHHWYDEEGRPVVRERFGRALPVDVPPGGATVAETRVRAPERPGRYVLVWDCVHVHAGWFSRRGVIPAAVPVAVATSGGPPPPVGATVPPADLVTAGDATWHPGRAELWSLALGMWKDHPWTGVGPDGFRRLYGRYAARPVWDTRTYANNALLEAAATTGTPGFLALAATLLLTLVRAWRRADSDATPEETARRCVALLGLAVALFAHSMIDYVFAFTGGYLGLAFVVGAVAAERLPRASASR